MSVAEELRDALANDAAHRRPRRVEEVAERARAALERPPSTADLTKAAHELDQDLVDHVRKSPWRDVEPDAFDNEFAASIGRTILRLRSCSALNLETARQETLFVYEWDVSRSTAGQ